MNWDTLKDMRAAGLKPRAVAVLTPGRKNEKTNRLLMHAGVLTIDHQPGTPFPAALLKGLDVMLFLDRCDQAGKLRRVFDAQGWPARTQVWCECSQSLVCIPVSCEEAKTWENS